ncbi:MAG: porin PorA family protein [Acidimicrobiia bacterium]
MRGKVFGSTALTLGILLLAAGLVMLFLVIPGMAQFPDDVDSTRTYEGELSLMLNAEALATLDLANLFIRDVPVTIDRHVQTLQVDGEKALVLDEAVMSGPVGPLQQAEDVYAIDRKTMESIPNFTDDARASDRKGLVVGFPIGTKPTSYLGWNGDTLETNTLSFLQEEEHEGLTTYVFTASSGPDLIKDPVLLSSFPAGLPKAAIEGLLPTLGLPAEAVAQFGQVLPLLPDPIPLAYTYTYETKYWVEPDTGVLIDYNKMESRSVGLNFGDQTVPIAEVMHLEYAQTPQSVADAVADAEDAQGQLLWLGKVLPYGLIAFGAILALLGIVAFVRKPKEEAGSSGQLPVVASSP